MTDPNRSSPTLIQGSELLTQRTMILIVVLLLSISMLLTNAGRDRLLAWVNLAAEAVSPRQQQLTSTYAAQTIELTPEQRRVARWIANRHRVSVNRVEQLVQMSFDTAANYRLDPFLLLAVISIESGFNPYSESVVGAQGLMQIMPKVHEDKFKPFGGISQALDPWINMQVGAQILREYIDRFGSETGGLRAYVGVSQDSGHEYPNRVMRVRERLLAAARGRVLA